MKSVTIPQEVLAEALDRVGSMPVYDYSHRGEDANLVGALGEVLVERWMRSGGIAFRDRRDLTTHDYELLDDTTFDVKTKDRTVRPRAHYECSVPAYNHGHQRPDGFLFVSLQRDRGTPTDDPARFHTGHLLGGQAYEFVDDHGVHWDAGEVDPANGTRFWTACINIRVDQLVALDRLEGPWAARSPST